MAIIGPKPWEKWKNYKNLWKNVNFSTLWTSCFYSLERRFFVLEYRKRYCSVLYCLKKKLGKWPFLDPPWVNPFGKMSIFLTFPTSYFYSLERHFFALDYRKRHFPFLYCRKKKKLGQWPLLGQNHGKNGKITKTFGKMTIFRRFELLVFIA